ncbi:calcium-binding protein, partial [Singulisphaera rosea]
LPDGEYQVRIADETGRIRTSGRQGYEVRLVGGVPEPSGLRLLDFGTAVNQSPVLTGVSTSGPVVEGQTMALSATFVDRDSQGADVALISWGDGTSSYGQITEANGAGTVSASHVYSGGGYYEVFVIMNDGSDLTIGGMAGPVVATVIGAGVHAGVLRVVGTDGPDKVMISNQDGAGLQVTATFLPNGSKTFDASGIGSIEVFLLGGDDRAQTGPGVGVQALIDGGDGNDWLKGGSGPAILRGGNGNDILTAGIGSAILLGGAGDDHLTGGPGRDILIGGQGADVLDGKARDDFFIGGSTRYDDALDSLLSLWDEWKSGRDLATRVANILGEGSGPRANGDVFLRASGPDATVVDDGARDVLRGGPGRDVFFATLTGAARDKIIDQSGRDLRRALLASRRPMLRQFPRRGMARLAHWAHAHRLPHPKPHPRPH